MAIDGDDLAAYRIGKRTIRIIESDLQEWVERRRVRPSAPRVGPPKGAVGVAPGLRDLHERRSLEAAELIALRNFLKLPE